MKIDISVVTLILTSFTALAAVIGPIISSVITVRSNERIKRFETYSPQMYSAVRNLSKAYSGLPRKADFEAASTYNRTVLSEEAPAKYREFSAAAYELMSLMPSSCVQNRTIDLLKELEKEKYVSEKQDGALQQLMNAIAGELAVSTLPKAKGKG